MQPLIENCNHLGKESLNWRPSFFVREGDVNTCLCCPAGLFPHPAPAFQRQQLQQPAIPSLFGGKENKTLIIKFLFPAHLPFPDLSKECHKSDKLKAVDYCGFMAFILPVKRANIRNNVVRPALEPNPAINQHSSEEGAKHIWYVWREKERERE